MNSREASGRTQWVFEIPERNYSNLSEQLTKMIRRSRKCKMAPPRFEAFYERDEKRMKRVPDRMLDPTGALGIFEEREVITHYYYVTVEGERPRMKGWDFIATIDHTDELNIIRAVPGEGEIPVRYRKAMPVCDHCNTTRRRTETFVVRNVNTNSYKQVGRNCLMDFFGGDSPAEIAALLESQRGSPLFV